MGATGSTPTRTTTSAQSRKRSKQTVVMASLMRLPTPVLLATPAVSMDGVRLLLIHGVPGGRRELLRPARWTSSARAGTWDQVVTLAETVVHERPWKVGACFLSIVVPAPGPKR